MTTAVEVSGVSKKFTIPYEKTTTLYESILGSLTGKNKYDEFWALKDVTFKVEKGESLGVIGGNGSGKSTLLKLIANILRPTKGEIKVNGRLTSFLELGIGFQQDLSARENIYLYGKIMGLRTKEINQKIEEIIKFSELERFIDTKIRSFSSGMQVRLAFATAIQTNPQILLVDEVLAVGDMRFQQKCSDYFNQYIKEKNTMIFVTHDLSAVRRFCDKTLLLRDGQMTDYGQTDKVIDTYIYKWERIEKAKEIVGERWGNKKAIISNVEFIDKFGNVNNQVNSGDTLTIRIHYETVDKIHLPVFGIAIYSENGAYISGTRTDWSHGEIKFLQGKGHIDCIIEKLPLIFGRYLVTLAVVAKDETHLDWRNREFSFLVNKTRNADGLVEFPFSWKIT